jgi:hypothetical protein
MTTSDRIDKYNIEMVPVCEWNDVEHIAPSLDEFRSPSDENFSGVFNGEEIPAINRQGKGFF